jgi:hypothetical protein
MNVLDILAKAHKVDPVGTEMLIDDVVYDLMADEALANRALINKAMAATVAQRVAVAKRHLARQYAASTVEGRYPSEDIHKAAQWLTGIEEFASAVVSKADMPAWSPQQSRLHPRDAKGRFSRGVNQSATSNPLQYQSLNRVAKPLHGSIKQEGNQRSLVENGAVDAKRAGVVQSQYEQADQILREFAGAFGRRDRDKIDVIVQTKKGNGEVKSFTTKLGDGVDSLYSEGGNGQIGVDDDILSIELDAGPDAGADLADQVASFNTMASMGGTTFGALANMPEGQRSQLTQAFMPQGPEKGKLGSLFDRFKAGSTVLDTAGQPKLAELARFAGTFGPEAEKVLDPRVRQAAYRYRGTEKEPDLTLMRAMNGREMQFVGAAAQEGGIGPVSEAALASGIAGAPGRPQAVSSPVQGSLKHRLHQAQLNHEPMTEDETNMRVRSDVAAAHLLNTIPLNRMIAELSLKSGNVLPSQGVLIDADGDVVSQAVGFGDDTYLPFNYANIKRSMRGGQYVRTRQQGGLTGEDMSAAVRNGARMATVVSTSGVYSIEFDPSLRGSRGGSDKARSMYQRYLQILDAVENSGMYTVDLSGREKAAIKAKAADITGTTSGQEYKDVEERLIGEARSAAERLTSDELDKIQEEAEAEVATSPRAANADQASRKRMVDDIFEEKATTAAEAKASKLRLNADGYKVALETLQQQFPYFIRNVSYEPLASDKEGKSKGFLESRGLNALAGKVRQQTKSVDQGYMRPGGIRAENARGGFYQVSSQSGHGKLTPKRPPAEKPETPEAPEGPGGAAGAPGPSGANGQVPGGPTMPGAAPTAGLSGISARFAAASQAEQQQALGELRNVWSVLDAARGGTGAQTGSLAAQQWEGLGLEGMNPAQQNLTVAQWVTSRPVMEMEAALKDPTKGPLVQRAFRDRNAMKQALTQSANASGAQDMFASGANISGHTDVESLSEHIADTAMKAVDAGLVSQPFEGAKEGDAGAYHTGLRPQARKISGKDVNSIETPEQYAALRAANPRADALARELGTDGNGYLPPSVVADNVSRRIKAIQLLPSIQRVVANDAKSPHFTSMAATMFLPPGHPNPAQTIQDLRDATGKDIMYGPDLLKIKPEEATRTANDLQDAWALVSAGRALELIHQGPGGGGGLNPKGTSGFLMKSAGSPLSKSLGSSTRRVQVVPVGADSLSRVISKHRAQGRLLVPRRG